MTIHSCISKMCCNQCFLNSICRVDTDVIHLWTICKDVKDFIMRQEPIMYKMANVAQIYVAVQYPS